MQVYVKKAASRWYFQKCCLYLKPHQTGSRSSWGTQQVDEEVVQDGGIGVHGKLGWLETLNLGVGDQRKAIASSEGRSVDATGGNIGREYLNLR